MGRQTTLTDPQIYRRRNGSPADPVLTDDDAKKPGAPGNVHEAAVPKPPVGDSSRQ